MKKHRKYLVMMLAVIMSVMMLLPACGGGSTDTESQEQPKTEETQTEETKETQTGEAGTAKDGAYDIMKGFEEKTNDDGSIRYLYFNDFMLVMPGNDKWSYEPAGDGQSVVFYLNSAKEDNFGGRLVTIHAYDINDDSYENVPSYSVGGVGGNTNMRFVAEYPTDVQWNGEDAQQDADYRELSDYLHKIGEGAVNSPLATADSSAEPVE